jgi:hypothetical protein
MRQEEKNIHEEARPGHGHTRRGIAAAAFFSSSHRDREEKSFLSLSFSLLL